MSITENLFSLNWLIVASLLSIGVSALAVRAAPWGILVENRRLQHLLGGITLALMLTWLMRAGIYPGLSVHLLGLTAVTLVMGWDLAILSGTLTMVAMTLLGKESWDGFFVNQLCVVIVPVLVSHWVCLYTTRRLPVNFFVYLFAAGFGGAALATAAAGLSISVILWSDGVYSLEKLWREYLRYLPLIMFPEGLINGIIMTGIMVFHPDWIRTFDARRYIDEQ